MVGTHSSSFCGWRPLCKSYQVGRCSTRLWSTISLTAQTRKSISGEIQLCHTSCILLDAGKPTDFLTTVEACSSYTHLKLWPCFSPIPTASPLASLEKLWSIVGYRLMLTLPTRLCHRMSSPLCKSLSTAAIVSLCSPIMARIPRPFHTYSSSPTFFETSYGPTGIGDSPIEPLDNNIDSRSFTNCGTMMWYLGQDG